MKIWRYLTGSGPATATPKGNEEYVVEPMEPRLLLSADALGVDASVLNLDANEQSAWEITSAADWSTAAATLTAGTDVTGTRWAGVENTYDSIDDDVDTAPLSDNIDMEDVRIEIVFLDSGVANGAALLDDIVAGDSTSITQVYLIDGGQDGIQQISDILQQHTDVDAVHIISHGSAGQIHLGNTTLSSNSLEKYQQTLTEWGDALSGSADILIYGCDIAVDAAGQSLVDAISTLTGADVAASDDLTGNSSSGGDWELEYRVGTLETDTFDDSDTQGWQGTLGEISSDGAGSAKATAMDANGNYVVVYSVQNQDGDGWGIYAQRYDSAGVAQGGEILVNQTTTDDQRWASVGMSDTGEFVVTWTSSNQDGDGLGVYARQFNTDGTAAADEFRVNTETIGNQTNSSIDVDATGNFIIVWQGNGAADSNGVFFHRFNADGSDIDGNEVIAHNATNGTTAEFDPVVAWQTGGKFVIAWEQDNDKLYFQRFDNSGSLLGSKSQIDSFVSTSSGLSIDANASGTFVVAYREEAISSGIYVRAFHEDGSNVFTNGDVITGRWAKLGDSNSLNPSVTIDDSGKILAAYQTEATGGDIHLQRINADGSEPGPAETIVTDAGDQSMPAIAILDVDNYAVAWNDVASSGINTQTENATNNEQQLSVNTGTTVDEGNTGQLITTAMLQTTDVDNTPVQLVYTLTAVPANGTLYLNAAALGLSDTFTQDDIDNGRISYDHDDSETTGDGFGFSVDDGAGTVSTGSFVITVNPVNDAPTATNLNSTSNYNEGDVTVAINDIVVGDADTDETITATLTLADTMTGTLSANDGATYTANTGVWTITDTAANVNIALANLLFSPTANNDVDTSITTHIEDATGFGPVDGTIILDVAPVNNQPILINLIPDQITTEDLLFSFQFAATTFIDTDTGDSLTYTSQLVGGTPLPAWLSFDAATYSFSGTPSNSDVGVIEIEVIATDTGDNAATATFDLTVNNVNNAPILSNNNLILSPGETVVINSAFLSATDPDHSDPSLTFTVSNVTGGRFELAATPGVEVTSFTQAQVAAGSVVFIDDGDTVAPAYDVTVGDGIVSMDPQGAAVSILVPQPPTVPITETAPQPLEVTPPSDPVPTVATQTEDVTTDVATDEVAEEAIFVYQEPDITRNDTDSSAGVVTLAPDINAGIITANNSAHALLKSFLIPPAVQIASLLPLPSAIELDTLTSEIRSVLFSDGFNDSLNLMHNGISSASTLHQNIVATSIAATTGLSVGYIAWLIRGGVLLSTALSSLPVWQFVDPLPVLAHNNSKEDDGEDDSLEEIIKEESRRADKQDNEPPHQTTSEETEILLDKQT